MEYDIFFPIDQGHNSDDALRYTAERVEYYLKKGMFLRGEELDAKVNVSTTFYLFFTIGKMAGTYKEHSTQSHRIFGSSVLPSEDEDGSALSR